MISRSVVLLLSLMLGCIAIRDSRLRPTAAKAIADATGVTTEEAEASVTYVEHEGRQTIFFYMINDEPYEVACVKTCTVKLYSPPVSGGTAPKCTKGCPCGDACIDCSKTCHK